MQLRHRLLVIAAGETQAVFIKEAMEMGHYVIAVDANPHAPGLKFAHESYNRDITNSSELIDLFELVDATSIVTICCDAALESVAEVTSYYNLPGISVRTARLSKNKQLQRVHLLKNSLACPKFEVVESLEMAKESLKRLTLPVVVKPVDSSGSKGVLLVTSDIKIEKAFLNAWTESRSSTVIIEQFLLGKEYSVEMWVNDGEPQVLAVSEKQRTDPPFLLDEIVFFPSQLDAEDLLSIKSMALECIKSAHVESGPVHLEAIMTETGPVIVEWACRGAGFKVFTNILPYICGQSTCVAMVNYALGYPTQWPKQDPNKAAALVFIAPKPGSFKEIRGLNEVLTLSCLEEICIYPDPGQQLGFLKNGSDRVGHLLLSGNDPETCRQQASLAFKNLEVIVT